MYVRMVPGARIELATPAFSGRRSTNELPRQRNFSSLVATPTSVNFHQKLFPFSPRAYVAAAFRGGRLFPWSAGAQLPLLRLPRQHPLPPHPTHSHLLPPTPTSS